MKSSSVEVKADEENSILTQPGKRVKKLPFHYQTSKNDDQREKQRKYELKMRDLYLNMGMNEAVLIPDWRIRSQDFIPKIGLFMGSLNGLNYNRKKTKYEKEQQKNLAVMSSVQFTIESKKD